MQALCICRLQYKICGFRTSSDECARPGNEANVLYCMYYLFKAELAITFVTCPTDRPNNLVVMLVQTNN